MDRTQHMRTWIGACASVTIAAMGVVCAVSTAYAQSGKYPNKPMRWVIPYAAGGGTDSIARPIAQKLGEVLGQSIVYENKGGGGGIIAAETVAKSAPDGYTFLVGAGNTQIVASALHSKLPYDPIKDFIPITKFATVPNVLVAYPGFPAKNLRELVAYGKANSGKINWSSSGNGAAGHLGMVLFCQQAGIKVTHVPFKGAGAAVPALLAGDVDLLLANTGAFLSQIRAGKLRAMAQGGLKRVSVLPDVPTFNESGYPGFDNGSFYELLAPAGTPPAIIRLMHTEIVKLLRSPEMIARLEAEGGYAVGNTPEQFLEEIKADSARWAKVIKEAGITVD